MALATAAFHPPTWPNALARLRVLCAADEVASTLRHQALNELTGVGALLYRVRARLGLSLLAGGRGTSGELGSLFDSIEARVQGAPERLAARFLPPASPAARADLVAQVKGLLEALGLEAQLDGIATAPAAIAGDEFDVAVGCLVENAVEALALGGREGSLAIAIAPRGDRWSVQINDNGVGVDESVFEHLLEPFYTTHPGRAGLGLKMARRIAHRWGGELTLARREPRGLSVDLLIPTVG
jgi:signal transduction histidine kinase